MAHALSLSVFKGTNFFIVLLVQLPCGGFKKSPCTSSILQIIFYIWSFGINRNILRIQKLVLFCLEPYTVDSSLFLTPL